MARMVSGVIWLSVMPEETGRILKVAGCKLQDQRGDTEAGGETGVGGTRRELN
jgi:hypothetical protein